MRVRLRNFLLGLLAVLIAFAIPTERPTAQSPDDVAEADVAPDLEAVEPGSAPGPQVLESDAEERESERDAQDELFLAMRTSMDKREAVLLAHAVTAGRPANLLAIDTIFRPPKTGA